MGEKPCIYVEEVETPIGILTVGSIRDGICKIAFGPLKETSSSIQLWARQMMLHSELNREKNELTTAAADALGQYFKGERKAFDLPVCVKGTPFQMKVWEALREIPYGETRSYKEIALNIHKPQAVRAVGGANNKNPLPIIIPCHRVIGSSGALVGYGGGVDKKERLLEFEKMNIIA